MTWRIKVTDIHFCEIISLVFFLFLCIFLVWLSEHNLLSPLITHYIFVIRGEFQMLQFSYQVVQQCWSVTEHIFKSLYSELSNRELQRRPTRKTKCIFRFSLSSDLHRKQIHVLLRKTQEKLDLFFPFPFCVAQTVELSKQLRAFLKIQAGFLSFHSEVWNVFWIQDDLI